MSTSIPRQAVTSFINRCPDAAMITLRPNGSAHTARIELAILDGQVCATGSAQLVRIRHLRDDPRCSLFVFSDHPWWLGLETEAAVADGRAAGHRLVRFLRARHPGTAPGMVTAHDDGLGADRPFTESDYLDHAEQNDLVLVTFEIVRSYGNLPSPDMFH
jgi:hypothetical protein